MPEPVDVLVVMGSRSDWDTMRHAADTLSQLGIAHDVSVLSAHRTPQRLPEFVEQAAQRGARVIIAGAGGAAALPGMLAALTTIPVLGVPIAGASLGGMDALLSIVQMPAGVPVGTLAIGRAGAINAALLAAAILALERPAVADALTRYRADQAAQSTETADPR